MARWEYYPWASADELPDIVLVKNEPLDWDQVDLRTRHIGIADGGISVAADRSGLSKEPWPNGHNNIIIDWLVKRALAQRP